MKIIRGSIVWASVVDPNGRNPKERPAIVISSDKHILSSDELVAVAVSSRVQLADGAQNVRIPWHRGRHPVTGLDRPCVAVCDWLIRLNKVDIIDVGGTCPPKQLMEILQTVARLYRK